VLLPSIEDLDQRGMELPPITAFEAQNVSDDNWITTEAISSTLTSIPKFSVMFPQSTSPHTLPNHEDMMSCDEGSMTLQAEEATAPQHETLNIENLRDHIHLLFPSTN
jgi:hypothetical protein